MGIHNRFHKRKLAIILNSFQTRYQRRKESSQPVDEDDLSEYTPSGNVIPTDDLFLMLVELSGILEHEDFTNTQDDENTRSEMSEEQEVTGVL